ncbi:hypothetical protein CMI47_04590 [Candidatus Pacearchaeota archaeon]|jgi:hypothetical protein|nr:hypothetical protein [Candidatus Pacearchaeota archaeon]|tara:strand:- start:9617 stop:10045 length:429 start_codon:yes stop_codon:yes gene_type:complete
MPKIYRSEDGDKCDSEFEVLIVDDLIERGIPYEFHPGPFEYNRPVRAGYCLDCDKSNVRKGATYTPDLYLPRTDIYVELKGGSMTQASRGRLADFCRTGEVPIRFLFRDNRKIKGTKLNHLGWAARNKCEAAVGRRIPNAWL